MCCSFNHIREQRAVWRAHVLGLDNSKIGMVFRAYAVKPSQNTYNPSVYFNRLVKSLQNYAVLLTVCQ